MFRPFLDLPARPGEALREQFNRKVDLNRRIRALKSETASQAGFRCFPSTAEFKKYVQHEILASEEKG